jgi:hypothetical protein
MPSDHRPLSRSPMFSIAKELLGAFKGGAHDVLCHA